MLSRRGFTLIELSIVLVIIGLIVGGILTGRDLIRTATARAQITQIEKYKTAVSTFLGKYNQLPGDISDPDATNFGFTTRGSSRGQGDGNRSIEATTGAIAGQAGEVAMMWVDLFKANMIEDGLTRASPTSFVAYSGGGTTMDPYINYIFPEAKAGNQTYIYVWSGSAVSANAPAGFGGNWFCISRIGYLTASTMAPGKNVTPAMAYAVDSKIDDGYPQSGNVAALYPTNVSSNHVAWAGDSTSVPGEGASTGFSQFLPTTSAQAGTASTCYDNNSSAGSKMQYSIGFAGGQNLSCALSIKMQ